MKIIYIKQMKNVILLIQNVQQMVVFVLEEVHVNKIKQKKVVILILIINFVVGILHNNNVYI